jgi:CRISPR-associated protein Csx16
MRIISFLGTGKYEPTEYLFENQSCASPFVVVALATLCCAREIIILATEKAEETHGRALTDTFAHAGLPAPRFERICDGRSTDELWRNFNLLTRLLRVGQQEETLLDITHGFRSLPFFAGAVVAFVRALTAELPARVVYGAFEARTANQTPVWDLTPFVDLLDWTQALDLFLRSGQADALAARVEALGRLIAREWASTKATAAPPRIRDFAKALRAFAEALATVRVGELLLPAGKLGSLALQLQQELALAREDIVRHLPPVAQALDRLEAMIAPLVINADHLAGTEGQKAMAALAQLYLQLGRYAETGIILREGWVSRLAPPEAARPGPGFDDQARASAERALAGNTGPMQRLVALRNDIEHAGFRKQPLAAAPIREQLERFVDEFVATVGDPARWTPAEAAPAPSHRQTPLTYFVTRHPGAIEWAARRGLKVDRQLDHLDVETIQPGDTVIGILPVNLAAEVCARGGRFFNLSLTVPPEARGRELSADELEQFGARLEEYRVEGVV